MVVALNREAINQGVDVFADPNYATGRPPALLGGDPWSGSGSPVAGSASTPAPDLFWQQWAFRARGIELLSEGQPPQRLVPFDGQGVRVAIFDTSPFGPQIGIKETLQQVSWITPTLNLTVTHPAPAYAWEPPAPATDVRGHGLFVAGLAHAVAPQSDISLTRVLDQYGQGDLYTLSRELHRFISDTVVLDSGDGAVINLSLGVHPPPNAAMLGLPAEIVSLETAILSASGFDIVVVGAAGNDGDTSAAQLPASYPTVIGLAASSAQRGRGCFSNLGDVAAPGGNGSMPGCTPEPTSSTALISLAPIVEKTDTGYAYWMGTSFAAPLASGTAALLLDAHNGALSPAQVAARIYQGAQPPDLPPEDESLGAGIISLKRTLLPFNIHLPLAASGP
jgi:subtilisin family serine protease